MSLRVLRPCALVGDFRRFTSGVALRFTVTRQIGVLVRFECARDSRPPPGVQPADRSVNLSLSFAW